ncbi:hypothetical protein B0H11DRAFT_2219509 [Mycena galericulata]|nr:hypothetical protein B0H11DRAFT_2219509 [Mycena galericulata]
MLAVTLAFVPAGPGVAQLPGPHPSHAMQPPTRATFTIVDTPNNNGYEHPILITRHTYDQSANPPLDKFTAEVRVSTISTRHRLPLSSIEKFSTRKAPVFWFDGAEYQLWMYNNYARVGPAGDTVISVGAVDVAINITGF